MVDGDVDIRKIMYILKITISKNILVWRINQEYAQISFVESTQTHQTSD